MREPRVQIEEDCPECDGAGELPEEVHMEGGMRRTSRPAQTCPRCHGDGSLRRWIALSELRDLLEQARQRNFARSP